MAHPCEKRVWCWWFVSMSDEPFFFSAMIRHRMMALSIILTVSAVMMLVRMRQQVCRLWLLLLLLFFLLRQVLPCRMALLWLDGFSCRFDGFLWLLQMMLFLMSCWWQDKWCGFWFLLWLLILLLSRHTRSNSHLNKVLAMMSQNESRMSWKQADWKSALE